MRRREFIAVSTAAVFFWPGAQAQTSLRRITVLSAASDPASRIGELVEGLKDLGYVEGKNIAIDFKAADGRLDRLPALAEAISRDGVTDVIFAESTPAAIAAHKATRAIPIVALVGVDPVGSGLAGSLARPGGNVTGSAIFADEANAKRVELVHELAPKASRVAAVLAIDQGGTANTATAVEVGRKLGLSVELIVVHPDRLADDLSPLQLANYDAFLFVPDVVLASKKDEILNLIAQSKKPAVFAERQWVEKGGLASFGPDLRDVLRRLAIQLARVLNGQNAGELPFERPTRFELRIKVV